MYLDRFNLMFQLIVKGIHLLWDKTSTNISSSILYTLIDFLKSVCDFEAFLWLKISTGTQGFGASQI